MEIRCLYAACHFGTKQYMTAFVQNEPSLITRTRYRIGAEQRGLAHPSARVTRTAVPVFFTVLAPAISTIFTGLFGDTMRVFLTRRRCSCYTVAEHSEDIYGVLSPINLPFFISATVTDGISLIRRYQEHRVGFTMPPCQCGAHSNNIGDIP